MTQQPIKICPRCQTQAAVDAQFCSNCGRQYSTQFDPNVTQVVMAGRVEAPVLRHTANLPFIVAAAVLAIVVVGFGLHYWLIPSPLVGEWLSVDSYSIEPGNTLVSFKRDGSGVATTHYPDYSYDGNNNENVAGYKNAASAFVWTSNGNHRIDVIGSKDTLGAIPAGDFYWMTSEDNNTLTLRQLERRYTR